MSALKNPQISFSHWVKFAGFLCFRRLWNMQGWADLYMYWRRKWRVSKGEYPLGSGFPIGASSIPVGTRFSVGKSSVLYLCFSAPVGQANFVHPWTKSGFAQRAKSDWPKKEARVYQNPRPAAVTAPSLVYFSLGFLTALIDIVLVLAPWAAKSGVGPAAQEHLLAVLAQA